MIDADIRTVRVGSTAADVWVRIEDKGGADLTAVSPQLRTTPPGGTAGDWFDPAPILRPELPVIRCRFEVTPTAEQVGWWEVEGMVDGELLALGGFRVIL